MSLYKETEDARSTVIRDAFHKCAASVALVWLCAVATVIPARSFGQVTQYWCSNVPVREVLDTAQGISTFSDSCAVMNASVPTQACFGIVVFFGVAWGTELCVIICDEQAHDESAAAPAPTAGGQSRYTHLRTSFRSLQSSPLQPFIDPIALPGAISSAKLTPFTTLPPIRSPLVVRVGMLLRQSTVLKSWKKAVVVLTVDGYLHVFEKSGDVLAGDSDVEALTTAPLR